MNRAPYDRYFGADGPILMEMYGFTNDILYPAICTPYSEYNNCADSDSIQSICARNVSCNVSGTVNTEPTANEVREPTTNEVREPREPIVINDPTLEDVFEMSRNTAVSDELARTKRKLDMYKKYLRELEMVMIESMSAKQTVSPQTVSPQTVSPQTVSPQTPVEPELNNECPICMDSEISVTLIPCGHCFCKLCSQCQQCPQCRSSVERIHVIYL